MSKKCLRKKRIIAVLFAMIIVSIPCLSRGKELYLLSGHPTPKADAQFPSYLYRLVPQDGTLQLVRKVVAEPGGTDSIHTDYDRRIFVLRTWGSAYSSNRQQEKIFLEFLDMDNPEVKRQIAVEFPADWSMSSNSYFIKLLQGGFYFSYYLRKHDKETKQRVYKPKGINLETFEVEDMPWEAHRFFRVSGLTGGGLYPSDFFNSIAPSPDGSLEIRVPFQQFSLPVPTPNWMKFDNPRDVVPAYVNNDYMLALASSKSRVKGTGGAMGHTTFHIFNKKQSNWKKIQIQGSYTVARGFGPWLVGYVAEHGYRPSPGHEQREKKDRNTGRAVEWLFKEQKEFSPGILFLYNVDTDKKYKIKTDQGDNEILLVDGDSVYYRLSDEIYKAKIGKNKIYDHELVVKDEIVPDIHWAFIGPSFQNLN